VAGYGLIGHRFGLVNTEHDFRHRNPSCLPAVCATLASTEAKPDRGVRRQGANILNGATVSQPRPSLYKMPNMSVRPRWLWWLAMVPPLGLGPRFRHPPVLLVALVLVVALVPVDALVLIDYFSSGSRLSTVGGMYPRAVFLTHGEHEPPASPPAARMSSGRATGVQLGRADSSLPA